jgi:hypothetical protein
MHWITLPERFRRWKAEIGKVQDSTEAAPAVTGVAGWCGGLAFNSAAFSQQLCNMQVSLEKASTKNAGEADTQRAERELPRGAERPGFGLR